MIKAMYDTLILKNDTFFRCSMQPFICPFFSCQERSYFCLVILTLPAEEKISHFVISFADGAEKQRKYNAENKQ